MTQSSRFSCSIMRAWCGAAIIITAMIIGIPLQYLSVQLKLPTARWIPVIFHRIGRRALGVKVTVKGTCVKDGSVLITANHCSWLDITVVGSLQPLSFIAKSEVAGWPIFGLLAKLQRTIFVNRTKRSETGSVAKEIAERLALGDAMVLFAEGTSSDGNEVLPFRTALIGAAKAAMTANGARDAHTDGEDEQEEQKVWLQPLSIAYNGIQGMPMGRKYRPLVAWYGDMDLLPHLWALIKEGAVDVTVTFGEPIPFGAGTNRKKAARQAEEAVRANMLHELHHYELGRP